MSELEITAIREDRGLRFDLADVVLMAVMWSFGALIMVLLILLTGLDDRPDSASILGQVSSTVSRTSTVGK